MKVIFHDDFYQVYTSDPAAAAGRMVREAAERCGGGCFGILEGGYNHQVLGHNVLALIKGLARE